MRCGNGDARAGHGQHDYEGSGLQHNAFVTENRLADNRAYESEQEVNANEQYL